MSDPAPVGTELRSRHLRRRHGRRDARARARAARPVDRADRGDGARRAPSRRASMSAPPRWRTAACGPIERSVSGATWSARRRPSGEIHVSEQGRFGVARIDASEQGAGCAGLCHIEPRDRRRAVAGARIAARASRARAGAGHGYHRTKAGPGSLEIETGDRAACGSTRGSWSRPTVRARCCASGRASRPSTGTTGRPRSSATLTTQRFHDHVAYERFTPTRAARHAAACRRTLRPRLDPRAGRSRAADRAAGRRLSRASCRRRSGCGSAGCCSVGRRQCYELALTRAERHTAPRLAIVGNAAQGLHPIAGQGFNLGLRDAASLAEVLADALAAGETDPGSEAILDAVCRMACRGSPPHRRVHRRAGASVRHAARRGAQPARPRARRLRCRCHRRRARSRV